MRFFRREIEVALKAMGAVMLAGLVVLPAVWGYQQRRLARTWQHVACVYRLRELTRNVRLVVTADGNVDACAILDRLGLSLWDEDGRFEPAFVVLPARGPGSPMGARPVAR